MKLILGLGLLLAAASAFAQVPPAPPRAAERSLGGYADQAPRGFEKEPKQVPYGIKAPPMAAPPMVPPGAAQPSNAEIADLLRKQTAAIKALNGQLGELEGRIGKLERGAR
ncbi:hypothetical protein [Curvibacter sp. PAE-UM]|uniref:hypothetical protein n=1 Tax=Curvibacter sp. PAE-UM TaxID=1714344 RepID=UPI00070AB9E6|nr:hypothetical protein [Curvibacter sp. PAE-UM]KRI00159.1 hypothetical protein AO057_15215 [Curvibacter sp. PAE-UM]